MALGPERNRVLSIYRAHGIDIWQRLWWGYFRALNIGDVQLDSTENRNSGMGEGAPVTILVMNCIQTVDVRTGLGFIYLG